MVGGRVAKLHRDAERRKCVDTWHMKHGSGHVACGTWHVALPTLLCPDGCTHSLLKVCRCGASRISVPSGRCAPYILAFPGSCPSTWETVRKKGVEGRRREEEHKDVEEGANRKRKRMKFFLFG